MINTNMNATAATCCPAKQPPRAADAGPKAPQDSSSPSTENPMSEIVNLRQSSMGQNYGNNPGMGSSIERQDVGGFVGHAAADCCG